jgi:hypothetical protein
VFVLQSILDEISQKDFDKRKYVDLVLSDSDVRDIIVENMISHPQIMVYYHCYYVVSSASATKPESFYKYWDQFARLLKHQNSYHRNFGLEIIANLVPIDSRDRLSAILDDYLELLKDSKIMTAELCVKFSSKIASVKPDVRITILEHLFDLEESGPFNEKQRALLMSEIINGFESLYPSYPEKSRMIEFAQRHETSISPKTRKVAKHFLSTYSV